MQGPGRAYFVNVRGIFDKLALKKSQLYLIFNKLEDLDSFDVGYSCEKCNFVSNEHICEMIDNLECIHEKDLSFESLAGIVYIAGYVIRRDPLTEDTSDYYEIKGLFLKQINRGGLRIPGDLECSWTMYCYVVFH